jgi:hypothetical protein
MQLLDRDPSALGFVDVPDEAKKPRHQRRSSHGLVPLTGRKATTDWYGTVAAFSAHCQLSTATELERPGSVVHIGKPQPLREQHVQQRLLPSGSWHHAIRLYLATYNEDPRPLIWVKTADEILATIERFCLRISETRH